jgi:glycerophosphoryl diester phosphodiesterase
MNSHRLSHWFAFLILGLPALNAMEIIAHRGASHDAPENTVAAFQLAWQQQADACELDIRLSKDGQVVVIHDDNTKRTTGRDKMVVPQTLEELRSLDAGAWKGKKWRSEKIPTLAEALGTLPDGKRFFIEIKCGPEVLPELARIIEISGKQPRQLPIIAFSYEVAKQAKALLPAHEVSLLYDWKEDKDTGKALSSDALIATAKVANLDGLDVKHTGPMNAGFVAKVKSAGLKLYVWTVDDATIARRMAAFGVDGITTNRPEWLRGQLK